MGTSIENKDLLKFALDEARGENHKLRLENIELKDSNHELSMKLDNQQAQIELLQQNLFEKLPGYQDCWGDLETLTHDELKERTKLIHSWVKLHQFGVNQANKIKNDTIDDIRFMAGWVVLPAIHHQDIWQEEMDRLKTFERKYGINR